MKALALRLAGAAAAALLASTIHAQPASCSQFAGAWSGTWSQGYYGTQWIHVPEVSPDCVAQVGYNPTSAALPAKLAALPIADGKIEFVCNPSAQGVCRLELVGEVMHVRYSDRSQFVNEAIFRRQ